MQRIYGGLASLSLLALGSALSVVAYHFPFLSFNYYQATGSVLFWAGAFLLAVFFLLGDAPRLALRYALTRKGGAVGAAYLALHLLLYGIVLEGILVSLYGAASSIASTLAFFSTDLLYPASLGNAVAGVAFSPSFTILIPPTYEASLSAFSVFTAVLIDILILANVSAVGTIGAARAAAVKTRAYILMPATGILLGASCCMSLPVLISVADPAFTILADLEWVFYFAYFVLPMIAAVLLKLNLDLARKTAERAARLAAAGAAPLLK